MAYGSVNAGIARLNFLPAAYPAPESLGFFLANDQAPVSLFSILQKAAHHLEYTKKVLRGLPLRLQKKDYCRVIG